MLNIMQPPALQGNEQAQLTQIYRYLFRLSEQLNAAAVSLDSQASKASEAIAKAVGIDPAATAKEGNSFTPLIALVVKTADIVHAQMDKIVTKLAAQYVAKSEWGDYTEEISREIEETARNTIESFIYDAKLESLTPEEVNAFDTHLEGFIARGIIGFEDDGITPIIGIAIGRNLLKRKETMNGQIYELIDTDQNLATYTADKLSFWINGVEVAYLSNAELVITRAIISDSIVLGDWEIAVNASDGMTVQKRIGSELDLSENDSINVTAEKINAIAHEIDLRANGDIQMLVGAQNEMQRWFEFDDEDGFTIHKPAYTDKDGAYHPQAIWKFRATETGIQIIRTDMPGEPILSAERERVNTPSLQIGDMLCKKTSTGGWVWTDA